MSAEFTEASSGFHRLRFKVDLGRGRGLRNVAVLISVDAYRKVTSQMARARLPVIERDQLLIRWARWEIAMRLDDHAVLPSTISITASDIDELGAYAHGLGQSLMAS